MPGLGLKKKIIIIILNVLVEQRTNGVKMLKYVYAKMQSQKFV